MKKILLTSALSAALSLTSLSTAKALDGFSINIGPSVGVFTSKKSSGSLILGGVDGGMNYKYNNFVFGLGANALFGKGYSDDISSTYEASSQKYNIYGKLGYEINFSRRFSITPNFLFGFGIEKYKITALQANNFLPDVYNYDMQKGDVLIETMFSPTVGAGLDLTYHYNANLVFALDNKFTAFIRPKSLNRRLFDTDGAEKNVAELTGDYSMSSGDLYEDAFLYSATLKVEYTF